MSHKLSCFNTKCIRLTNNKVKDKIFISLLFKAPRGLNKTKTKTNKHLEERSSLSFLVSTNFKVLAPLQNKKNTNK